MEQSAETLTCRSEGIYPEPELTWSSEPPSALGPEAGAVQQSGKLFNISSSLTFADNDSGLNYTCTIRTRKNMKTATFLKPSKSLMHKLIHLL